MLYIVLNILLKLIDACWMLRAGAGEKVIQVTKM